MSPRHPIPDAALDDRLGFLGTSGSGKRPNPWIALVKFARAQREPERAEAA